VRGLAEAFGALPKAARAVILVVAAGLVGVAIWGGVSSYLRTQAARAEEAFATASAGYRQAIASGDETALAATAESLRRLLATSPPAGVARQAWYLLGNVEYRRRAYDAALAAFEAAGSDPASIGALSRLGAGYAWEAKGDLERALTAYRAGVDRGAKDFLFGESLLGVARVQEALKQPAAALESYQRYLKDVPGSGRADEVRGRIAQLGAAA
jgi:tetratricopeptide (TPR) repeat protein